MSMPTDALKDNDKHRLVIAAGNTSEYDKSTVVALVEPNPDPDVLVHLFATHSLAVEWIRDCFPSQLDEDAREAGREGEALKVNVVFVYEHIGRGSGLCAMGLEEAFKENDELRNEQMAFAHMAKLSLGAKGTAQLSAKLRHRMLVLLTRTGRNIAFPDLQFDRAISVKVALRAQAAGKSASGILCAIRQDALRAAEAHAYHVLMKWHGDERVEEVKRANEKCQEALVARNAVMWEWHRETDPVACERRKRESEACRARKLEEARECRNTATDVLRKRKCLELDLGLSPEDAKRLSEHTRQYERSRDELLYIAQWLGVSMKELRDMLNASEESKGVGACSVEPAASS